MTIWLGALIFGVWIYILYVLSRSDVPALRFIWGSAGVFVLLMILVQPVLTEPLAKVVASIAGGFGKLTGMFSAYFKYGVLFVDSDAGSISLLIDFECSGILEIMAFVSLLAFYKVYTRYERVMIGVLGVIYIILANALRIIVICSVIYVFGMPAYYIAHTFVGRIVFYGLSILLYFFVFTKAQIIRQKVGGFSYGLDK
ncbi:MAG: exosortase family protein XrtG [Eubacterium sp.]|nr:exosortase family protein XrtG [Eubacterium sp.]